MIKQIVVEAVGRRLEEFSSYESRYPYVGLAETTLDGVIVTDKTEIEFSMKIPAGVKLEGQSFENFIKKELLE